MRTHCNLNFLAPNTNIHDLPPEIAEEIGRLIAARHSEPALLAIDLQLGQIEIYNEAYRRCGYLAAIFQTPNQYLQTMQPAFFNTFNWLKRNEELYKRYPHMPEPRTNFSGKNVTAEDLQQNIQATVDVVLSAQLKSDACFSDSESRQLRDAIDGLTINPGTILPIEMALNIFAGNRMWGTWMHRLINLPKDERDNYLQENILLIFLLCLHFGEIDIPRYLMTLSPHLASHAEILPMIINALALFAPHMETIIKENNNYQAEREALKQQAIAKLEEAFPNDPETRDYLLNSPNEDLHNLSWLPKQLTLEEYYEQQINRFKTLVELALRHGPGLDQTFQHHGTSTTPRKEIGVISQRIINFINENTVPGNRQALIDSVFVPIMNSEQLAVKRISI